MTGVAELWWGKPLAVVAAPTVKILQFDVSTASLEEHAKAFIASAKAGHGLWICTLNLEMVGRALQDPEYAALMARVDVFIADGASILLLARMANGPIPKGRSNGTDLVQRFLEAPECDRIGIIGGIRPEGIFERLQIDRHRVSYLNSGTILLDKAALDELTSEVEGAGCQLVLVALGVPKQDIVCDHLRRRLRHLVVVGVGGSFDFLAGLKPRAPFWMQRFGLETLFRLGSEPRRLSGRYLVLYPLTIARLARLALRGELRTNH